jgi:segregation and condensation protein A
MTNESGFKIKTEEFEGPLDLLLGLVEKRKFFINDISLSRVTDEFIEHVNSLPNSSIENRANFIVVASTLLLVKSKSLLPTLDLSSEEEESIDDLERRLKLLQKYRDLIPAIKDKFGDTVTYEKSVSTKIESLFAPHDSVTPQSLFEGIQRVILALPKKEKLEKAVLKNIVSLEKTIETLTERVTSTLRMSFSDFSKKFSKNNSQNDAEIRVNVIVSFLAMLELAKQGIISVEQEDSFGDIDMQSNSISTPRYE